MVAYGSKQSTLLSREVSEDTQMEPGKVYHAEFAVEGIRTLLPGWESDVLNSIYDSLSQKHCEAVYIDVDSQNMSATVQYRLTSTGNATALFFDPITIGLVVLFVATVVLGIYLISLTLTGGVKELSTVMTDNPTMTPIIYGGVALALIVAFIYLKNQFSSSDT
jgi:hypothetical protein